VDVIVNGDTCMIDDLSWWRLFQWK